MHVQYVYTIQNQPITNWLVFLCMDLLVDVIWDPLYGRDLQTLAIPPQQKFQHAIPRKCGTTFLTGGMTPTWPRVYLKYVNAAHGSESLIIPLPREIVLEHQFP